MNTVINAHACPDRMSTPASHQQTGACRANPTACANRLSPDAPLRH